MRVPLVAIVLSIVSFSPAFLKSLERKPYNLEIIFKYLNTFIATVNA